MEKKIEAVKKALEEINDKARKQLISSHTIERMVMLNGLVALLKFPSKDRLEEFIRNSKDKELLEKYQVYNTLLIAHLETDPKFKSSIVEGYDLKIDHGSVPNITFTFFGDPDTLRLLQRVENDTIENQKIIDNNDFENQNKKIETVIKVLDE